MGARCCCEACEACDGALAQTPARLNGHGDGLPIVARGLGTLATLGCKTWTHRRGRQLARGDVAE
eukprot:7552530-Lingulodinium_polyedra.AAC.1